ncbi:MAG: mechanosensitive ion channel, partial [Anaerolineales bacterium]
FLIARGLLARGLLTLAAHTKTKYDDIIVKHLRPFRVAWLAPVLLIYAFAYLAPEISHIIRDIALFFILWITAVTFNALLSAANEIYESRATFQGVSIQGYLDLVKILILLTAVILSVSLFTGQSPVVLLTGLGALTAVLLFVFQDTLLALVASVQIGAHHLIKEGDWIEVPSYNADGDVIDMNLHTIKVRNWDNTISIIPTSKINQVAYKNWRGMTESGGRRIKRAIFLDLASVRFCDQEMIARFRKIDVLSEYLDQELEALAQVNQASPAKADSPLDQHSLTNLGAFRVYIEAYLRSHPGIHQEKHTFLVRQLAPGPTGVPLEVYVFTKTTDWIEYETIQAEIFDHLLAAVPTFDLRVFQEPTGLDFAAMARRTTVSP